MIWVQHRVWVINARVRPHDIVLGLRVIDMDLVLVDVPGTGCGKTKRVDDLVRKNMFPGPTFVVQGFTQVSNAHDNEESTTFDEQSVRGGDNFRYNRFERPFTAGDMQYLPHIDIVDISMTEDSNFYYVQVKLAGVDPATGGANGYYAVDFDLNIDGKAEFVVIADHPSSSQWTADGVTVYIDENNNVGGQSIRPDDVYTGDGFEKVVFDSGNGDDPDTAWVHFVNNAAPVVEIAFKKGLLEGQPKFMWSVTSSQSALDPTKMYFNDTFSEQRAGSPVKGNEHYPLNELAGIDNTCRLPAGFHASGTEPLGCNVSIPNGNGDIPEGSNWTFDFPVFDLCDYVIWC